MRMASHINSRANVMILLFTRQRLILVNTQVQSRGALLCRGLALQCLSLLLMQRQFKLLWPCTVTVVILNQTNCFADFF